MQADYRGIKILKPWGWERQLIETATKSVAVWHLRIESGRCTSFHAHKFKKTNLIVVGGPRAEVRFLGGSMMVNVGEKVTIRAGQYHQTQAPYAGAIDLLEVETPSDKSDLVRLEDKYGRAGKPYEGPEAFEEDSEAGDWRLRLLGHCSLRKNQVTPKMPGETQGQVVFLSGGVRRGDDEVLGPGDVVPAEELRWLADRYELLPSEVIEVTHAR